VHGLLLATGFFSPILPASFSWLAAGGIAGFAALISWQYCRSLGHCSPVDAARRTAEGQVGERAGGGAYDDNGPLSAFGAFAPGWVFSGTVVDQFRRRGSVNATRAPFQTLPMAP
jgi:hypothetical protein